MGYPHDFGNLQMATNGVAHPQFLPVSPTLQHQSWHPPVQPFSRHATHVACRPIGVRDAIARRPRCKPLPFARPSESFHASPVARDGLHPGGYRTGEILMGRLPWGLTGTHSVPRTTPQARGSLRNRKQEKTCRKSENLRTSSSWKPINFTMCIMHSNKYHCTCGSQDLSPPKFHTSAAPRKHAAKNLHVRAQKPCLLVYLPMLAKSTITRH